LLLFICWVGALGARRRGAAYGTIASLGMAGGTVGLGLPPGPFSPGSATTNFSAVWWLRESSVYVGVVGLCDVIEDVSYSLGSGSLGG